MGMGLKEQRGEVWKDPKYLKDANWQNDNNYYNFSLPEMTRTTTRRGKLFSVKVQTIILMTSLYPKTLLNYTMVIPDTSLSLVDKTLYFHSSQMVPRASVLAGAEQVTSNYFITELLALMCISLY